MSFVTQTIKDNQDSLLRQMKDDMGHDDQSTTYQHIVLHKYRNKKQVLGFTVDIVPTLANVHNFFKISLTKNRDQFSTRMAECYSC